MAKPSKNTTPAVTETPKTALAVMDATMFEADAKQGLENVDRDSLATPFLMVLQANSPQLDRTQPEFVKGASSGDIMLSTNSELFRDGDDAPSCDVILCYFDRQFTKWLPRSKGGGFRGSISPAEYARQVANGEISQQQTDNGKTAEINAEGEIVKDSRIHYVLVVREDGTFTPAILTMASTQIKKSKIWLTLIDQFYAEGRNGRFNPPSFAHVFTLTTVGESNDQGNWQGWKISRKGYVQNAELYAAAKALHDQVKTAPVPMAAPPVADGF